MNNEEVEYARALIKKQMACWKSVIGAQTLYSYNIRRLKLGFVLDIGCGIGRNLIHLKGSGVGIDSNIYSVKIAIARGVTAFTPDEFRLSHFNIPQCFDSILLSHVTEHMHRGEVIELLRGYLALLKPNGKLIIIAPQEAGYRSDLAHVEFMDFCKIHSIVEELGFVVKKEYSFPFPRIFGDFFTYNEFISISFRSY